MSEWGTFRAGDGHLSIGMLDEEDRIARVEALVRAVAVSELDRLADLLWDDPGPGPSYIAARIQELQP
jgi:hypothetical protein